MRQKASKPREKEGKWRTPKRRLRRKRIAGQRPGHVRERKGKKKTMKKRRNGSQG
jgi:hypothetical protein